MLLLLAAVDTFSYKISSWGEFMDSIEKSDEAQRKYMLELVSQLFPNEKTC